jgi:predicted amino acid-binding ACT domain protein
VTWAGEKRATYAIELEVIGDDRAGLLADLTQAIAGEGSNIRRIEARSDELRKGYVSVSLEASDMKHLQKILTRLRSVAGVREVIRKYNVPKAGERGFGVGTRGLVRMRRNESVVPGPEAGRKVLRRLGSRRRLRSPGRSGCSACRPACDA